MSTVVVAPTEAIVVWALSTNFDELRCVVWPEGATGWRIAILFGNDLLGSVFAPNKKALRVAADVLWDGLLTSGFLRSIGVRPTPPAQHDGGWPARIRLPHALRSDMPERSELRVDWKPATARGRRRPH